MSKWTMHSRLNLAARRRLAAGLVAAFAGIGLACHAAGATSDAAAPRLSADQIVQKFIAARGGLQAWHAVQSMNWTGRMQVGYGDSVSRSERYVSNSFKRSVKAQRLAAEHQEEIAKREGEKQVELPFLIEMKRPAKSRVELQFAGKTAVQVYDGQNGWLKRPYLNRDGWEPFSAEQAKSQVGKWELEGPLMDYAAKGAKVAFEAMEPVEGHDAYRLKLTLKSGEVQHVWIDAKSFLDVKVEGTPRRMDGKMRAVYVYQRDFRAESGVVAPHVLETAVDGYAATHKMFIEKVSLNPPLDDAWFVPSKP